MERMGRNEFKHWLEQRTASFAVETFKLLDELPHTCSTRIIAFQLGKSASSIGANYREANRAESHEDFVHKISIALKEASESLYWTEILSNLYPAHTGVGLLSKENSEIRNLLQSIRTSASKTTTPKHPGKSVNL